MDEVRDELSGNHLPIHIVDFDFYDVEIFNQCERQKNVMLVIEKWSCVHPMMKVIPVDWDYEIPFGILHPPKPSRPPAAPHPPRPSPQGRRLVAPRP